MTAESKRYIIEYKEQFIEDVLAHKKAGRKTILTKINSLINEIEEHPTTGTGKPEALKGNRKGQWSRRITREYRLIYEIHEDILTVLMISASGHYGEK
ncbi:Txe/YoeB family addiction module toxin [uncultured Proteiniphilum sp.]|mgnify:CR=1 FL=1|uniref:Txe/YoeB family addiction module toxin n=1 Tax=uncultured Proteiniphilum sp. TaxID=497637 RepID=UPI00261404D2|nr:Txe/YoeB family addiction module toxin [uncultured Proteiniphilum sp.]